MKPKHFLLFCILLFISSCCPSKSFFEEKFSETSNQILKIDEDLTSIDTSFSKINSDLSNINNRLDTCCQKSEIVFKTSNTLYCGIVYMTAHNEVDGSNTHGAITFIDPTSQDIKGFLYEFGNSPALNLRDTVEFKIKHSNLISFAYDIKRTNSCNMSVNQIDDAKKKTKIDFHNKVAHTENNSHVRGHIDTRKTLNVNISRFNQNFDLSDITVGGEKKEYYIPSNFSESGCSNPNKIFMTIEEIFHSDGKRIILEIGCTHNELH